MEHADALTVDVEERQVIELLQQEMTGVIQDAAAWMTVHPVEEHLECDPVMQVLAGVDLVGDIHPCRVEGIEDGRPALGQLVECRLDQPGRALRPRIEVWPGQRAGKSRMRRQPQIGRGLCCEVHLLDRPGLPRRRAAPHLGRGEPIEGEVVGRMHRHELALQVGRKLRQLQPGLAQRPVHLVAIGPALCGQRQVEQPLVPARYLHALVAKPGRPARNRRQRVIRRGVAGELRQEDGWPFDGLHIPPTSGAAPRWPCSPRPD